MAKKVSDVAEALQRSKSLLVRQSDPENPRPFKKERRETSLLENKRKTLDEWKALANAPGAYPADFRRYALALSALDSPQNANIPAILQRVATYKTPPYQASSKALLREYQQYIHPIPAEKERELWEAVYSRKPFDPRLTSEYLARIEALRLNWFASIAKRDLYNRAGRFSEAQAETQNALASGVILERAGSVRVYLLLAGISGWIFLTFQNVARYSQKRTLPVLALLKRKVENEPLEFGYHPRVFVFMVYLVLPFAMLILSPILSPLFKGSSALAYIRANVILYLIESAGALIFCVWLLRRRAMAEGACEPMPLRETFAKLGWNAPLGSWWLGLKSYALILLPLLIATALSQALFSRYETPAHPVILSVALMKTPFDWLLIFLQTAVLAPLVEETLFRGTLYPALRSKMGVMGGIAASSAVFAILHPTLPAGFLPLFLLGAVMAYLYETKGSLAPGILLHALNNGFILLLQLSALAN